MNKRLILSVFFYGCIVAGCDNSRQAAPVRPLVKKPDFVAPFRYHKLIEVSPGRDFDVLSWGRGSATSGSFLILHSDSAAKRYTTTTGDLEGTIVDVYNSDMDLDGNPEILIQARGTDSSHYTTIYAFEFNNSGKAQKLDFPKLSRSQRSGYRGGDNFFIKEGKLIREFPIYSGSGNDSRPTGAKRVLEYGLSDHTFTVRQLSKDSLTNPQQAATVERAVRQEKHTSSRRHAKKRTLVKKHARRRRHRRR